MENGLVAFITVSSEEEARKVARAVLEPRLAACVNVVPGVVSHYWWQGKIEEGQELLLVVKTMPDRLAAVIDAVKAVHSYTTPEVIAMPIVGGYEGYLQWLRDETRPATTTA